jgi:hypothetical protein
MDQREEQRRTAHRRPLRADFVREHRLHQAAKDEFLLNRRADQEIKSGPDERQRQPRERRGLLRMHRRELRQRAQRNRKRERIKKVAAG